MGEVITTDDNDETEWKLVGERWLQWFIQGWFKVATRLMRSTTWVREFFGDMVAHGPDCVARYGSEALEYGLEQGVVVSSKAAGILEKGDLTCALGMGELTGFLDW